MNKTRIRSHILELCSEDAYGSWEFWLTQDKADEESNLISETVAQLVAEKKLETLERKSGGPFAPASLDIERLKKELYRSQTSNIDPNSFYWFAATDEGKKEDQILRSSS